MIIDVSLDLPVNKTRPYRKRTKKIIGITNHATAGTEQNPFTVARRVLERHKNWGGIPYHIFIQSKEEKKVYRCNPDSAHTYHARMANAHTVSVVIAYLALNGQKPSEDVMDRLYRINARAALEHKFSPNKDGSYGGIRGHREYSWMVRNLGRGEIGFVKACPGLGINMDMVRLQSIKTMQREMLRQGVYNGRIDGIFGPKSDRGLSLYRYDSGSPFLTV